MATCSEIIANAMKLTRVLPSGASATTAEAADGLKCLQSLYDGFVAGGMFGQLEDVYLDANDVAEEGKRYFVPTGITLTAPTSVYTLSNGQTRQPRDLAIYESLTQAGTRTVKLYDRTAWVPLTGLVASDTAPLSGRGEMGLSACLAIATAFMSMFGAQPDEATIRLASMFLKSISSKRGSTQDRGKADYY